MHYLTVRKLWGAALAIALLTFVSAGEAQHARAESPSPAKEISPAEDLMREHGVLRRLLLVYEEVLRRWEKGQSVPPRAVTETADLIRSFVEDYHEKLEEIFIFPRFENQNTLADLTASLRQQHAAGRLLTRKILALASAPRSNKIPDRAELAAAIRQFILLYRPHAAREDTVLYPALRRVIPERDLIEMGDVFEAKEVELFGPGGFEKMVETVAGLEKLLGIYDLSQFAPPAANP